MLTKTVTRAVSRSGFVDAQKCIAISFFRPTDSPAFYVQGIPVESGQTWTINQRIGDFDVSRYEVVFASNSDAANVCYVMQIIDAKGGE